jgi:pimeloyl-ACP methyl ester carboxylesterase
MIVDRGNALVNGTEINYEHCGSGPSLTFIHGFTLDMRMWDDQFHHFAQAHTVLRYDMRGFGRSALPTLTPYSHAEDLYALHKIFAMNYGDLVGLSMGGQIAFDYALRYPAMVRRLVLIDPFLAGFGMSKPWQTKFSQLGKLGRDGEIEAARTAWKDIGLFDLSLKDPEVGPRLNDIIDDYSGWHFANSDDSATEVVISRLEEVQIPVLILVGEHDIADFHSISEFLEQHISKALCIVVKKADHMANMDQPEQVNALIEEFLA